MPSWVENVLTIEAVSLEHLVEIRGFMAGNETRTKEDGKEITVERAIDFQKICPMPPELNIEDSSVGDEGYDIICKMSAHKDLDDPNLYDKFKKLYLRRFKNDKEFYVQKAFNLGRQYYQNWHEHGCKTWKEWRWDNWGTKWNSLSNEVVSPDEIFFMTASAPPIMVILSLSAKFPDAKFVLEYSSEDSTAGVFQIVDMKISHEHSDSPPDRFDKLRRKLRKMKHEYTKK